MEDTAIVASEQLTISEFERESHELITDIKGRFAHGYLDIRNHQLRTGGSSQTAEEYARLSGDLSGRLYDLSLTIPQTGESVKTLGRGVYDALLDDEDSFRKQIDGGNGNQAQVFVVGTISNLTLYHLLNETLPPDEFGDYRSVLARPDVDVNYGVDFQWEKREPSGLLVVNLLQLKTSRSGDAPAIYRVHKNRAPEPVERLVKGRDLGKMREYADKLHEIADAQGSKLDTRIWVAKVPPCQDPRIRNPFGIPTKRAAETYRDFKTSAERSRLI
ncbi:hypothetical protein C4564_05195 [Candidatus Microgenomates bacterium]|nr:MAG: hypothetical protein C4564_05195 [Candidatus Microgenomates bacterium]